MTEEQIQEMFFELRQIRRTVLALHDPVLPKKNGVPRGYLRGGAAAASYLGIDRGTFRDWQNDPDLPGSKMLRPRIIRGEAYYKISTLDLFMEPSRTPVGTRPTHPFKGPTSAG